MGARCDFTDLPADTCAHCLKQPDPDEEQRREMAALLRRPGWFAALYRGQCPVCGEWFGPGFPIHYDATERWIGGCCADSPTAPTT